MNINQQKPVDPLPNNAPLIMEKKPAIEPLANTNKVRVCETEFDQLTVLCLFKRMFPIIVKSASLPPHPLKVIPVRIPIIRPNLRIYQQSTQSKHKWVHRTRPAPFSVLRFQTDISGSINSNSNELEAKNSQIQSLTRVNRRRDRSSRCCSVRVQERDDFRRQVTDTKRDYDKQSQILQKCLGVNKKLLVEKVSRADQRERWIESERDSFSFQSTLERKQARQKCMENRLRLGQFVTQRQGATFVENWTDGNAFTDISKWERIFVESVARIFDS